MRPRKKTDLPRRVLTFLACVAAAGLLAPAGRAAEPPSGDDVSVPGVVRDAEGQSTCCHGCGERLIGREGYVLSDWNLDGAGRCRACGTRCPGVFEASPGTWGPRRQPVRLAGLVAAE